MYYTSLKNYDGSIVFLSMKSRRVRVSMKMLAAKFNPNHFKHSSYTLEDKGNISGKLYLI